MAKVLFNPIMEQIRGKIGELVFRRFQNRVIITRKPDSNGRVPTDGQLEVQTRFRDAARFAKHVLADPARRALYEPAATKSGRPLRITVMGEFLNSPEVTAITVAGYHGRVGDPVDIQAVADVAVTGVAVAIRDASGAVLEEGAASLVDGVWRYLATVAVPAGESVTVEATATNLAGQTGTLSVPVVIAG